tara:strand:+ start:44967 stop:46433 length:1467 start_codon:yes stop_codon:yes gene_type:complete
MVKNLENYFEFTIEQWLITVSIMMFLIIIALIWLLIGLKIQGKKKNSVTQTDFSLSQEKILQKNLELFQTGLQALQSVFGEKVGSLEKELIKDASDLKLNLFEKFELQKKTVMEMISDLKLSHQKEGSNLREYTEQSLNQHRNLSEKMQLQAIKSQQETLATTMNAMSGQLQESLKQSSKELGRRVESLSNITDERLKDITGQVEKRLASGFEKTTETFGKVLEHLARIDEAQKKIKELSGNVVSLQEVLTDKRSRGAFGEVQLSALVKNIIPKDHYKMQATLSNGKRVDCLLKLPSPTGDVPIDAKFPLETYKKMVDVNLNESDRLSLASQFRRDIKTHIRDISDKYLINGETSDGAVMFLPAEAIFAEIHAHFPDLVEESQRARVWIVSPTTLMAVLTTARSVLKDDATRKQVHVIREHLRELADDFSRFQQRMEKLSTHIRQAKDDVDRVNISAQKISGRFQKIEQVDLHIEDVKKGLPSDEERK